MRRDIVTHNAVSSLNSSSLDASPDSVVSSVTYYPRDASMLPAARALFDFVCNPQPMSAEDARRLLPAIFEQMLDDRTAGSSVPIIGNVSVISSISSSSSSSSSSSKSCGGRQQVADRNVSDSDGGSGSADDGSDCKEHELPTIQEFVDVHHHGDDNSESSDSESEFLNAVRSSVEERGIEDIDLDSEYHSESEAPSSSAPMIAASTEDSIIALAMHGAVTDARASSAAQTDAQSIASSAAPGMVDAQALPIRPASHRDKLIKWNKNAELHQADIESAVLARGAPCALRCTGSLDCTNVVMYRCDHCSVFCSACWADRANTHTAFAHHAAHMVEKFIQTECEWRNEERIDSDMRPATGGTNARDVHKCNCGASWIEVKFVRLIGPCVGMDRNTAVVFCKSCCTLPRRLVEMGFFPLTFTAQAETAFSIDALTFLLNIRHRMFNFYLPVDVFCNSLLRRDAKLVSSEYLLSMFVFFERIMRSIENQQYVRYARVRLDQRNPADEHNANVLRAQAPLAMNRGPPHQHHEIAAIAAAEADAAAGTSLHSVANFADKWAALPLTGIIPAAFRGVKGEPYVDSNALPIAAGANMHHDDALAANTSEHVSWSEVVRDQVDAAENGAFNFPEFRQTMVVLSANECTAQDAFASVHVQAAHSVATPACPACSELIGLGEKVQAVHLDGVKVGRFSDLSATATVPTPCRNVATPEEGDQMVADAQFKEDTTSQEEINKGCGTHFQAAQNQSGSQVGGQAAAKEKKGKQDYNTVLASSCAHEFHLFSLILYTGERWHFLLAMIICLWLRGYAAHAVFYDVACKLSKTFSRIYNFPTDGIDVRICDAFKWLHPHLHNHSHGPRCQCEMNNYGAIKRSDGSLVPLGCLDGEAQERLNALLVHWMPALRQASKANYVAMLDSIYNWYNWRRMHNMPILLEKKFKKMYADICKLDVELNKLDIEAQCKNKLCALVERGDECAFQMSLFNSSSVACASALAKLGEHVKIIRAAFERAARAHARQHDHDERRGALSSPARNAITPSSLESAFEAIRSALLKWELTCNDPDIKLGWIVDAISASQQLQSNAVDRTQRLLDVIQAIAELFCKIDELESAAQTLLLMRASLQNLHEMGSGAGIKGSGTVSTLRCKETLRKIVAAFNESRAVLRRAFESAQVTMLSRIDSRSQSVKSAADPFRRQADRAFSAILNLSGIQDMLTLDAVSSNEGVTKFVVSFGAKKSHSLDGVPLRNSSGLSLSVMQIMTAVQALQRQARCRESVPIILSDLTHVGNHWRRQCDSIAVKIAIVTNPLTCTGYNTAQFDRRDVSFIIGAISELKRQQRIARAHVSEAAHVRSTLIEYARVPTRAVAFGLKESDFAPLMQ